MSDIVIVILISGISAEKLWRLFRLMKTNPQAERPIHWKISRVRATRSLHKCVYIHIYS